jgi:hypothetical protein
MNIPASAALYRLQMTDVLRRIQAVERILGAKKPRLLDSSIDDESMWLQIRKIVELVTFGGITADEERYAALRSEDASPDYTQDWKVNTILPKLVRITPHFLPIPIDAGKRTQEGLVSFDDVGPERTSAKFIEIYNRAGEYLHIANPFSPTKASEVEHAKKISRDLVREDLAYLKNVLWVHAKVGLAFDKRTDRPTEATNPKTAWLVRLGFPKPNNVEMMLAEAIDVPDWVDEPSKAREDEPGPELAQS